MKRKNTTALLAVLCICWLGAGCGQNYSNGERVGIVTKLSKKGLIWDSWEGEMIMALPADIAGTTTPEKFEFNVAPECVDKVQAAMKSGKRVTLVYREWWYAPPTIEHDHVIIDVK
jgi:hypothetical protein